MDAREAVDDSLQALGASPLNLHGKGRERRDSYVAEKIEKTVSLMKDSMASVSGKFFYHVFNL